MDKIKDMIRWYVIPSIIISLILLLSLFCCCRVASAETISDDLAIKAIMGEARGEGYKGMLAVACAIRNRGTLKGVYGVNAKFTEKEYVWDQARKAWKESLIKDITNGADHWESDRFKEPYWAKDMIKTVKIGHHQFYKEKQEVQNDAGK